MNPISRFVSNIISNLIPTRFLPYSFRGGVSLRTQLIFWNIVALSLLLGGLGIVCRFVMLSFMMQSVDQELERSTGMFLRPPPSRFAPSGGGGHSLYAAAPFAQNEQPSHEFGLHGNGPKGDGPRGNNPEENSPYGHPQENGPRGHGLEDQLSPLFAPNHFEPNHSQGGPGPHGGPESDNPYRVHHFTAEGQSETPTDKRPVWDPQALIHALRGETLYTTATVDGDPIRVFSSPGFTHIGKKGAVQVAYPLKELYRALAGIDTALLVLIPIGLLGAGYMGSALTNRVLRPVRQMTQAAGHIGTEKKTESFMRRLPVNGNDEFAALASTFNGLLGRLHSAFQEQQEMLQQQQRFTADASHELKTPLTIVKGRASLALSRASTDERSRHTFHEINEAADTMSQLVQDLLLLARSDEGHLGHDRMELLVCEILETARAQALHDESKPITLCIEPANLSIMGNEAELIRLFRNLLDNAVRYTPAEGQITVTAHALPEDPFTLAEGSRHKGNKESKQKLVVTVTDRGTGIAPEHLPHLGERFYRVDASRTRPTGGTGLGLSICRSIVEAHGGTMSIASALNVGTTVTVILP